MKTYKVTEECIACHACVEVASNNFDMGSEYAYIKKQPENADEEKLCDEASEVCPVNAIDRISLNNCSVSISVL